MLYRDHIYGQGSCIHCFIQGQKIPNAMRNYLAHDHIFYTFNRLAAQINYTLQWCAILTLKNLIVYRWNMPFSEASLWKKKTFKKFKQMISWKTNCTNQYCLHRGWKEKKHQNRYCSKMNHALIYFQGNLQAVSTTG